jgi:ubiquinone/menaquinone biosynthesis C-methylase UbiE
MTLPRTDLISVYRSVFQKELLMDHSSAQYLLAGSPSELERLRLQARVWEPEAETMLDQIGIQAGWSCIDLGCGPMGILDPLSRRVGASGRVIGVDNDQRQLAAARAYAQELGRNNIELVEQDAYQTDFARGVFDFVHVRFVFAPVGRDEELLREMIALTRPGGIVAIQEPDATCWNCFPHHQAWDRLKQAILAAFEQGGGDLNAGQRTYGMLRNAGLEDVHIRAAVIALQNQHPYMRLPIQFATSLRQRILGAGLLSEAELDASLAACEQLASHPETSVLTFIVTQVWGRKSLSVSHQ